MAFKLREPDDDLGVTHEINVTPFIDVMLVLLIIFMIAAPLATVDVAVDLPVSSAQRQPRPGHPVFLTIKADRSLVLGDLPVTVQALPTALAGATNGDKDQRVFLRADKSVDYDTLMQAMNVLRDSGYLRVALVGLEHSDGL